MFNHIFHSPFSIFNLSLTTLILVLGAALFYAAYLVIRFNRQIARLSNAFIRMPASQKVVFILGVTIATVSAQKGGTNETDQVASTNNGEAVSSPLVTNLTTASPLSVTDVERGYRLESVTLNPDVSYAMPDGAAVVGTWYLTGAYEDVVRVGIREQGLGISGWSFPLGAHLCDYLWAYTWGKVRPQLKNASNEIAAVGTPMSAIPQVSRFWTVSTTNGSRLLTWENFALGRIEASTNSYSPFPDPSSLVSAQLELCRNGDFVARSNNVESVYRRVNPDDWDDDGIPNEEDDEPLVCGEESFGAHQVLPADSTTNFYYWVDLVVSQANARVIFEGDGDSNLADPSFIAKAGETNRVYLLIGKTYSISCAMPILCVNKEDEDVEVYPDDNGLHICWDISLEFVFEPPLMMAGPMLAASSGGGGTRAKIRPERARGGAFSWTGTFCCYHFATDGSPVFTCSGNCGCGGYCHTGNIVYIYLGYSREFDGWSCSCEPTSDDDVPTGDDDEPDDPQSGAIVSAQFSKKVVLFEDTYTNAPVQIVQRSSTTTELTCYAYGGDYGGSYEFTADNLNKLEQVSGDPFPLTGTLAAGESIEKKMVFKGAKHSGSENDIFVFGTLSENLSGGVHTGSASMTSVRVRSLTASTRLPNRQRKCLGVGESSTIEWEPSDISCNVSGAGGAAGNVYQAPSRSANQAVKVSCMDAEHTMMFQTFEPQDKVVVEVVGSGTSYPGTAGDIGAEFTLCVIPTNVSFESVQFAEIGMVSTDPIGYFSTHHTNYLDHSLHGANNWHGVNPGNMFYDEVALPPLEPPWGDGGSFTWPIPNAWRIGTDDSTLKHFPSRAKYNQRFELESDGTSRIEKMEQVLEGRTNTEFRINGELQ